MASIMVMCLQINTSQILVYRHTSCHSISYKKIKCARQHNVLWWRATRSLDTPSRKPDCSIVSKTEDWNRMALWRRNTSPLSAWKAQTEEHLRDGTICIGVLWGIDGGRFQTCKLDIGAMKTSYYIRTRRGSTMERHWRAGHRLTTS